MTLAENHLFSANIVNTVRLSFSRPTAGQYFQWQYRPKWIAELPATPLWSFQWSAACCASTNRTSERSARIGWADGTNYPFTTQSQNIYTLSDDVFWNKGKHAFKFGVLLNRYNQPLDLALRERHV